MITFEVIEEKGIRATAIGMIPEIEVVIITQLNEILSKNPVPPLILSQIVINYLLEVFKKRLYELKMEQEQGSYSAQIGVLQFRVKDLEHKLNAAKRDKDAPSK